MFSQTCGKQPVGSQLAVEHLMVVVVTAAVVVVVTVVVVVVVGCAVVVVVGHCAAQTSERVFV